VRAMYLSTYAVYYLRRYIKCSTFTFHLYLFPIVYVYVIVGCCADASRTCFTAAV